MSETGDTYSPPPPERSAVDHELVVERRRGAPRSARAGVITETRGDRVDTGLRWIFPVTYDVAIVHPRATRTDEPDGHPHHDPDPRD